MANLTVPSICIVTIKTCFYNCIENVISIRYMRYLIAKILKFFFRAGNSFIFYSCRCGYRFVNTCLRSFLNNIIYVGKLIRT